MTFCVFIVTVCHLFLNRKSTTQLLPLFLMVDEMVPYFEGKT